MIKQLLLRNFQKHKRRRIRFGRVTTIVGPNDTGKTACVRALFWVSHNRPSGMESIIRKGSKGAYVKVDSDGCIIERRRTKTQNTYTLNGEKLKSFNKGVPEQVSQALKLDRINFQLQLDSHFWISESPTQVSQSLNEIVDLQSIDSILSYLSKELRRAQVDIKASENNLEAAVTRKKALRHVPQIDSRLRKLEESQEEILELTQLENKLGIIIGKIEEYDDILESEIPDASYLMKLAMDLLDKQAENAVLSKYIERLEKLPDPKSLEKEIALLRRKLKSIEICPTCHRPL